MNAIQKAIRLHDTALLVTLGLTATYRDNDLQLTFDPNCTTDRHCLANMLDNYVKQYNLGLTCIMPPCMLSDCKKLSRELRQ